MLSACFADKLEHTEMDLSDTDCPFQSVIKRNSSISKDDMVVTSDGYYILGHFENQARGMLQI